MEGRRRVDCKAGGNLDWHILGHFAPAGRIKHPKLPPGTQHWHHCHCMVSRCHMCNTWSHACDAGNTLVPTDEWVRWLKGICTCSWPCAEFSVVQGTNGHVYQSISTSTSQSNNQSTTTHTPAHSDMVGISSCFWASPIQRVRPVSADGRQPNKLYSRSSIKAGTIVALL